MLLNGFEAQLPHFAVYSILPHSQLPNSVKSIDFWEEKCWNNFHLLLRIYYINFIKTWCDWKRIPTFVRLCSFMFIYVHLSGRGRGGEGRGDGSTSRNPHVPWIKYNFVRQNGGRAATESPPPIPPSHAPSHAHLTPLSPHPIPLPEHLSRERHPSLERHPVEITIKKWWFLFCHYKFHKNIAVRNGYPLFISFFLKKHPLLAEQPSLE